MKVNSSLALNTVIAVAVGYVIYRIFGLGDAVAKGAKNFSDGVRLYLGDSSSLGVPVQSTPQAALSRDEHLRAGHLEVLPNGRTQITAAGRLYIEQQQREAALNP